MCRTSFVCIGYASAIRIDNAVGKCELFGDSFVNCFIFPMLDNFNALVQRGVDVKKGHAV